MKEECDKTGGLTVNDCQHEIWARLEAIVAMRLFGDGDWPANPEAAPVLSKVLQEMGLEEPVPNRPNTARNTAFGKALNVDLLMVFMGLMEPWDSIATLEEYNLLDDDEADTLFGLVEAEKYSELRTRVQQAYRDYHNRCRFKSRSAAQNTTH
jgi:hypothetical protein